MTTHAIDSGLDAPPTTTVACDGSAAAAPAPLEPRDAAPPLGREARRRIGRNLRLLYADVLHQPLPDRFAILLDSLSSPSDSRETS